MKRAFPRVDVRTQVIHLNGGLDVVTSPIIKDPGVCVQAQNFEQATNGGYRRIAGYERYSGKARPSDATYTTIAATISGAVAVGDTLVGDTSAATGTVIAVPTGMIVLTKVTGTYVSGENLKVGGTTQAVATGSPVLGGASTSLLDATYLNAAADVYRALIAAVPGTGRTRGVVQYNDVVYAWRNTGLGTAAIYKSSSSGWTAVTLYNEVSFTVGGTATPADGETLTQGGVTATIKRVVRQSGAWTGTAAGRFVITNPAGGNFAAGAATTTSGATVTISGAQTAITILADGTYEFDVSNMGGSVATKRIYGADGINRGFEFDGDVYVPIATGMASDTPSHVREHMSQLFFAFGGSAQHSGPGTPYVWSAVLGAGELAMSDTITGFSTLPGNATSGALAIFTRNRTSVLYGTGSTDWVLAPYRKEMGAYAGTIQDIGMTMYLDDRGLMTLATTQKFGNFSANTVSDRVRPRVNELRTTATASCISRDLNQYRVFFTGGEAFYVTVSAGKILGTMPILLPDPVRCIWSGEQTDGSEAIFFGSDDGMVYQMEKGTSFDGDEIEYYFNLAYNHTGSPRIIKHWRHTMLEIEGSSYVTFNFGYSLGYGTTDIDQAALQSVVTSFAPSYWDAFTWDAFTWDGRTLFPSELDMGGDAENCSLAVYGSSDLQAPFTITAAVVHFSPRRAMR